MPDDDENQDEAQHGGKRSGAGRPRGSVNRRTSALREAIEAEGVDPAIALVRIGKAAEARAMAVTDLLNEVMAKAAEAGVVTEDADLEIARRLAEARAELSLAADCYGRVLPFVHARPRTSADAHPEEALEFAKAMLTAKIEAAAKTLDNPSLADRLARAKAKVIVQEDGSAGVAFEIDPAPAATVIDAQAQPVLSPRPTMHEPTASPEKPEAPAYTPILPRGVPPASADWSAPAPASYPQRQAFADADYSPFESGGLIGSRNT